jgi:hypothetical protein
MHKDLETMMHTFVIKYVFVIVESLVKNQFKSKSLELSFCIILFM